MHTALLLACVRAVLQAAAAHELAAFRWCCLLSRQRAKGLRRLWPAHLSTVRLCHSQRSLHNSAQYARGRSTFWHGLACFPRSTVERALLDLRCRHAGPRWRCQRLRRRAEGAGAAQPSAPHSKLKQPVAFPRERGQSQPEPARASQPPSTAFCRRPARACLLTLSPCASPPLPRILRRSWTSWPTPSSATPCAERARPSAFTKQQKLANIRLFREAGSGLTSVCLICARAGPISLIRARACPDLSAPGLPLQRPHRHPGV